MMSPDGPHTVGGVGDVTLRHFRDLRAFDCYKNYYVKREEAQILFKQEISKKSSGGFTAFVEVNIPPLLNSLAYLRLLHFSV